MMKLYSWGANNTGQLGHGFCSEQVSTPTEVILENFTVDNTSNLQISGGGSHTTILNCDTKDYKFLNFGLISTKFQCHKEQILPKPGPNKCNTLVKEMICSGWDFTIFVNSYGELFSLGDNTYKQLGRTTVPSPTSTSTLVQNGIQTEFSPDWGIVLSLKYPMFSQISNISAGMRHAALITLTSELYTWGDNSKGQTGLDLEQKAIPYPVLKDLDAIPIQVRCSKMATIILDKEGNFFGCGLNKFGILGKQGSQNIIQDFVKLFNLNHESKVKDFQCGWNHGLILFENGKVMSWGRNNFHQLGRSTPNEIDPDPGYVEGIPEVITSISCGSEHNLVKGISGQIYAWGWNEHDNCGIQQTHGEKQVEVIDKPTKVPLPEGERAVAIGCGAGNSFVVTIRPK